MEKLNDKYRILELDYTATVEDVKRSYKRLCLKYHPDKNSGDSEQFIKIKRAYEEVMKEKESNINFFIVFYYFMNVFGKNQTITISLVVPLEDVYMNKVKKLSYGRVCKDLVRRQETVYLELSGWKEQYVLDEFGDFNIITKRYGELVIKLDVSTSSDYAHLQLNRIINLYDIHTTIMINIYEYYYGVKKKLKYFADEDIWIEYNPYRDGSTQLINGKGLMDDNCERYDLYIFYNVDFTRCVVDDSNEEIIKNIFNK